MGEEVARERAVEIRRQLAHQRPIWIRRLRLPAVAIAALICTDALAIGAEVKGTVFINAAPAADAVVYLRPDEFTVSSAPMTVTVRQDLLRFRPAFRVVTVGSTVRFENDDVEIHSVYSESPGNEFDIGTYIPGAAKTVVLAHPGPVFLRCRIHANMRGLIFVSPSPYFAVTDRHGRFTMAGVLPGAYRAEAWHHLLTPAEMTQARRAVIVGNRDGMLRFEFTTAATGRRSAAGKDTAD